MSTRKRVSQACQPCGLKKIKCDGALPQCDQCQKRSEPCSYGVSKRKSARGNTASSPRNRLIRDEGQPPANSHDPAHPNSQGLRRHSSKVFSSSVSAETSAQLFHTYFNCIHPLWPILYKPLYASLDFVCPSQMMSPALVSAIFAIASCVQTPRLSNSRSQHKSNCSEPRVFFEAALDLLQQSSEEKSPPSPLNALKPSISACQVLVILALQQHGLAEYSTAAMLCGLASAMAIEMRLHRSYGLDDPVQTEVRSRLWWNLFILEKMMAYEMGRPVGLRSEETDCPYPSTCEADEFELMPSYIAGQDHSPAARNKSIKLRTISGLHTSIRLTVIFERISREMYGVSARKALRDDQIAGEAKRMELWLLFQEWQRDVDASPLRLDLSDDLSSVPTAITNYICMWSGTILVHRPFIARWQSHQETSTSINNPLDICLQAANSICQVLEKYFDYLPGLPCDIVFPIFTAASTLLYHSKHVEPDGENTTEHRLKLCIHWLSIFGKSWKTAGARRQLLADMSEFPQEPDGPAQSSLQRYGLQLDPLTGFNPSISDQWHSSMPITAATASLDRTNAQQPPVDDWGFLGDFGDATDEFYSMDVEFRGLLDAQFGMDNIDEVE